MVQPEWFLYTERHKAFGSFPGKRKLQICAEAQMGAYMNIEIANRLVNLRNANNLSQEALAEKLGISRQAVSKWERAEASPDTDNLILLARLYGVSLDELLRTEDEIPMPEEPDEQDETDTDDFVKKWNAGTGNGDENVGVHIGIEGIDVQKDGQRVHVGWNGIHVEEEGGEKVHVGWNGIYADEHGGSASCEEDGWDGIHIVENGREVFPGERGWTTQPRLRFPTALIVCIAYLVIGIVYHAWHPGWLLLLWIPILESLITAVRRRNASHFAYPVLMLLVFLSIGFLEGNWMGWIAFLTIPVYYSLVSFIKDLICHLRWKKRQKKQACDVQQSSTEGES